MEAEYWGKKLQKAKGKKQVSNLRGVFLLGAAGKRTREGKK